MPGFIAAIPSSLYRHSPPLSTIILPVPHRHSRVSGNPGILACNRRVFSGTVRDSRLRGNDGKRADNRRVFCITVRDSRLRGNDGREWPE